MKPKKVCILMSLTGGGHRSVAQAIVRAARCVEGLEATIRDPFANGSPSIVDRMVHLYAPIIVSYPPLWGLIFHGSDHPRLFSGLMRLAGLFHHGKLARILKAEQPDLIVSVHPLCNHLALSAAAAAGIRASLMTVVTELVSAHAGWVADGTTAYVAATESIKNGLMARGADPARIHVLGLPIDERFGCVHDMPSELRAQLGLRTDLPVVLLSGGGEGAGPLVTSIEAISSASMPLQLMVVCGRNQRVLRQIQSRRFQIPVQTLGFVDNMPQLLHAADVVCLKAGSVSVAEALVAHRPIVVLRELPGQEKGNGRLVVDNHRGFQARTTRELVQALRTLIKDPHLREEMGSNGATILSPCAATSVAKLALEL
ncbi:MAG: glycosyltransferase [Chloroflexota bacterium]|nr:MAG: glycosyltransferase [Chloroflexota bacterium]